MLYDKPLIYYPITVQAIWYSWCVITTSEDLPQFTRVLGMGAVGHYLKFAIQESPDGLAQAYLTRFYERLLYLVIIFSLETVLSNSYKVQTSGLIQYLVITCMTLNATVYLALTTADPLRKPPLPQIMQSQDYILVMEG